MNFYKLKYLFLIIFSASHLKSNAFDIIRELDVGARASATYDSNLFGVSENVFNKAGSTNSEVESRDDFILNFHHLYIFQEYLSFEYKWFCWCITY